MDQVPDRDLGHVGGDLAETPAIAWRYDQDTPYVPSPLLYEGGLYFLKHNSGILTRLDAATGRKDFTDATVPHQAGAV